MYKHIYDGIQEDNYEKIIEYADYTLCIYDITANGGWTIVEE